jgi:hypothetical protein
MDKLIEHYAKVSLERQTAWCRYHCEGCFKTFIAETGKERKCTTCQRFDSWYEYYNLDEERPQTKRVRFADELEERQTEAEFPADDVKDLTPHSDNHEL